MQYNGSNYIIMQQPARWDNTNLQNEQEDAYHVEYLTDSCDNNS